MVVFRSLLLNEDTPCPTSTTFFHKDEYDIIPQIAHSYWTTGKTWKDVPVILFDYNENKQDTVNEKWVKYLWK